MGEISFFPTAIHCILLRFGPVNGLREANQTAESG
jgi:hypothetical protein